MHNIQYFLIAFLSNWIIANLEKLCFILFTETN